MTQCRNRNTTVLGELTPESFKATTTHVARRDALEPWWPPVEFIFEDYRALHMTPRLQISAPDRDRFLGGHIDDAVARYSRAGPTSVVLLHEAYPQSLGLYDEDLRSDAGDFKRSLLFFLGAVKDMTPEESRAVVKACRTHDVPCIEAGVRAMVILDRFGD
eukprot:Skav214316  [mRNA]  locus=scaffold998:327060:334852:+ [translate_table: standard]